MHHRSLSPRLTLLLMLSFLVISVAIPGPGAVAPAFGQNCGDCTGGGPCSCGDTVVCDTKLAQGKDPVLSTVCSGDGLFVKNNVTLHVAGTLRGSTAPGDRCGINLSANSVPIFPPHPNCSDPNGCQLPLTTGVRITTGRIVGFTWGICIFESNLFDSHFTRLTILDPSQNCIHLSDGGVLVAPSGTEIRQVYCEGAGDHGIRVEGGPNTIERVTSVWNGGSGFSLHAAFDVPGGTTLQKSVSLHNKGDGLTIEACNFTITNNSFSENEGFGIQDSKPHGDECPKNNYTNNTCVNNDDGPYTDPPGPCL